MSFVTWVKREGQPGRLGAMARPGQADHMEDDLRQANEEGIEEIISLLTDQEIEEQGLAREPEICEQLGIGFRRFPIPDHSVPPLDKGTMDFLRAVEKDLKAGRSIAFHCSKGRGRTTLMAASILVLEGKDPDVAIQRVRGPRLVPVPDNKDQTEFVRALARGRKLKPEAIEERQRMEMWAMVRKITAFAVLGSAAAFALYRRRVRT